MRLILFVLAAGLVAELPGATAGAAVRTNRSAPSVTAAPAPAPAATSVRADADWALRGQLADGAIAHYVDQARVWPYLANFAAMGLARATESTGDPKYAAAAWRWLLWYQAHETVEGFVTDYVVTNGVPVSTGDMDSTDAYAGTYLLAARRTWKVTGDLAKLKALAAGVDGAVRAIIATQDVDGLTWAKPTWKAKYLMDQAEAYAGLRAGIEVANAIGNRALAQRASDASVRMKAGVDKLWNAGTNSYDWTVHENGVHMVTRWNVMYPDALQQTWAVAFGLVTGSRATSLMSQFTAAQPNWDKPAATATFDSGPAPVGYWPVTGWALRRVGRTADADTGTANIRAGAAASAWAWPYTTGNAGQLITLESADGAFLAK